MPKIVNHEQRKMEIADVAITVFAKNSLESATMQKIADTAGIAKGSIYKYFNSKEELVTYILVSVLKEFESALRNADDESLNPVDRLRLYLFSFIESINPHEQVFLVFLELWIHNIKGKYKNAKSEMEQYFNLYQSKISEILIQGQKQGLFKDTIDAKTLSAYLVASLDGILIHYLYNKSFCNLETLATSFFEAIIDGIKSE
ncbi:MAG: TetR/AcrR family transcriptional regulator [Clostridiales bacterium]|nr:TetR/AcrR family transcriptional regulator [Clostridiales bacterium]